jgi:YARHG domain-containing protein
MRLTSTCLTAFLATATLAATASVASAQSCYDLWIERNSYYKAAGYCFKTTRAINMFGNQGCFIYNESDVRLDPGVRARVNQIVRLERQYGCPR